MARGFAAALVNGWLDTAFATANCFVRIHTGDPGAAGTANGSAGDTTRKQATMAAASAGSKAMTGTAGPWTNGAGAPTTETISDISIWSAITGGTFNASAALTASQPWVATNTLTLTQLQISITPIAS